MNRDAVIILTSDNDVEVDPVIAELSRREVPVFRFDVAYFPMSSVLDARNGGRGWQGRLTAYDRVIDLAAVRSVWHRRPTVFKFDGAMPLRQQQFAFHEARRGIGGVLYALEDVLWVNHPEREATADFKPYQLAVAAACGFHVPRTIITNDPAAARAFYDELDGGVVYKTLSYPQLVLDGQLPGHSIMTRRLEPQHLQSLDRVRHTACMFQELVPKQADIRVIFAGERLLAAEIHSQRSERTQVDYRAAFQDLTYARHALPTSVESSCRDLMSRLGLMAGAIDLVHRPDGEYVLLEVNPSGQAMWLETHTGLPIAAAMADLLTHATAVTANTADSWR
jgi:ATP-grasp ribosomal peptide maturase